MNLLVFEELGWFCFNPQLLIWLMSVWLFFRSYQNLPERCLKPPIVYHSLHDEAAIQIVNSYVQTMSTFKKPVFILKCLKILSFPSSAKLGGTVHGIRRMSRSIAAWRILTENCHLMTQAGWEAVDPCNLLSRARVSLGSNSILVVAYIVLSLIYSRVNCKFETRRSSSEKVVKVCEDSGK